MLTYNEIYEKLHTVDCINDIKDVDNIAGEFESFYTYCDKIEESSDPAILYLYECTKLYLLNKLDDYKNKLIDIILNINDFLENKDHQTFAYAELIIYYIYHDIKYWIDDDKFLLLQFNSDFMNECFNEINHYKLNNYLININIDDILNMSTGKLIELVGGNISYEEINNWIHR